ncbi:hypothetical protein [Oleidesulfovibrio sp.]|uniref:hypothetical protein n=1 Tax=Oleidesulfovibrio sp. TaxID=2909707 RepID=UPI003A868EA5
MLVCFAGQYFVFHPFITYLAVLLQPVVLRSVYQDALEATKNMDDAQTVEAITTLEPVFLLPEPQGSAAA